MPDAAARDDPHRTSALAYWRYAHDYLRAARSLCARHDLGCEESQVPFHLVAQSLEFALKAHLRSRGLKHATLAADPGRSLERALSRSLALDLPPLPAAAHAAVLALAPHHGEDAFRHVEKDEPAARLVPLYAAIVHVLDAIVPAVVTAYVAEHGSEGSPTATEFVRRVRADLAATAAGYGD